MSTVAVHGPPTWQEFFAQNDDLVVNLLGPLELEFKSLLRRGASSWEWDFGDASPLLRNGYEVRHIFTAPGAVTIKVRIETQSGPREGSITIDLPDGAEGQAEISLMPAASKSSAAA